MTKSCSVLSAASSAATVALTSRRSFSTASSSSSSSSSFWSLFCVESCVALSSLRTRYAVSRTVGRPANRSFSSVERSSSVPSFSSNITSIVGDKVGRNLHLQRHHPVNIIKKRIERYFAATCFPQVQSPLNSSSNTASTVALPNFRVFDNIPPKVSVRQNFDELLFPMNYIARNPSDSYFYDQQTLLRTHTSAHQTELLRAGHRAFLVFGDCYRRDEVDASHYPVFHQVEGVRVWDTERSVDFVIADLRATLEGLVHALFGPNTTMRWVNAYFPFTDPSLELEVFYQNKWLEILGSGRIQPAILTQHCSLNHHSGWAFGIGLERLAMKLFDIPDIRLFWSEDPRFLSQFSSDEIEGVTFKPYSKFPECTKDITFWLPSGTASIQSRKDAEVKSKEGVSTGVVAGQADSTNTSPTFHENDFYEDVRSVGGDLVERVQLIDEFEHPKTKRVSQCYRITYRSMDRTLENAEVDELQFKLRKLVATRNGIELR